MSRRTKSPQFRVTESEFAAIDAAAKKVGLSRSDYLRGVVLPHLNGQTPSPAPQPPTPPQPGPAETAQAVLPPPSSPPGSGPAVPTSPSEPDRMVGKPQSDEAPVALDAAGSIPGSGKTCPDCGGTEGRHQSFCVQVRGEAPVEIGPGIPTGEGRNEFIQRRTDEQIDLPKATAKTIAEAEWRHAQETPAGAELLEGPDVPAPVLEPCGTCGTMKLPTEQCRDCGARPVTYQ